jgi:hypothetical protein
MSRFGYALALAIAVQLVGAGEAQAYIDPGTGSFIFQALVAMVVGVGFTLKLYWNRLKGLFGRRSALPADASPPPAKDEGDVS